MLRRAPKVNLLLLSKRKTDKWQLRDRTSKMRKMSKLLRKEDGRKDYRGKRML